jgi:unsaturated rhamnogalacturonyl hydrolase
MARRPFEEEGAEMRKERVTSLSRLGPMILIGALVAPIAVHAQSLSPPSKAQVESAMGKVNSYWIAHHTDPGANDWARSVYFLGDVAHYLTTGQTAYLDYATNWAEHNGWGLYSGCSTTFADYQAAGRVYLALNDLAPAATKTSCITSSINGVVSRYLNHQTLSYWSWIDALYMAMPTYAKLSVDKLDRSYSDAMHALYQNTKVTRGLYNASKGLWYRDGRYKPPVVSPNGKDVFWSRGNGWVFAAHADVLAQLPRDDPNYAEYLNTFGAMARALKAVQRPDGFWNVNLADPDDYPGPETSGTALFAHGMARGIEMGVLSPSEYLDPVVRAWNGLTTAIHSDGKLGFVQRPGEAPSSAQPVTADSTTDFGVGLFLLAGSAVHRLVDVEERGLSNLALNRLVTCSSAPQPENGCAHTVDGDTTDRWSALNYPQWVEVDLGAVYSISGVKVYPYLDRAYRYYVEVKTGAADPYVLVADRSGNSAGGTVLTDSFASISARFVRLWVEGASGYTGYWVSVRELEIFN